MLVWAADLLRDEGDKLILEGKRDLSRIAADYALIHAPKDNDATSVHKARARLGRLDYIEGDLKSARRNLLSSSFGVPKNYYTNLWLGYYYQLSGANVRAWARYFQAFMVTNDSRQRILAITPLCRLNNDPAFREGFTTQDAIELFEGRLPGEYHPIERYTREKDKFPGHARLVEMFINSASYSSSGAQLAGQGLSEYFGRANVICVEYHIGEKTLLADGRSNQRMKFYEANGYSAVLDGTNAFTGIDEFSGPDEIKMKTGNGEPSVGVARVRIFPALREDSIEAQPRQDPKWSIEGTPRRDGASISGTLEIKGPILPTSARLHVLLCESAIMAFEGNSLMFHRNVVRAVLSPSGGQALGSDKANRGFEIKADTVKISAARTSALAEQAAKRPWPAPTYIDRRTVQLVAFVQDMETKEILAVRRFTPVTGKKEN
ncbi:MAG TPA: hypothetical protein ENL03_03250 [Phycisphaerae bacterium]|nr:hypothetical protein [Phycisphaerae bacterium]